VLVVYTEEAANASGNIEAEIQLAVDETNASYENSQIQQRISLVGTAPVDYVEERDLWFHLAFLSGTSEGRMDEVHQLRDETCADLVSLWVERDPFWCGMAWLMDEVTSSFASLAFSVVRRDCATGNLTFGHELGHNMGAHHDRYVELEDGAFSYSHGLANPDARWRTVMAYDDECFNQGFSCTRIPYWSNPDVLYEGDPTGVDPNAPDSADNARTLNNTAFAVANFRPSEFCCHNVDPNNPDSDSDGLLDESDPCTVVARTEQTVSKSLLILRNLSRPLGKQAIIAKGYFRPATLTPELQPQIKGVHFQLKDRDGILIDVNIPGGAPSNPPDAHCGRGDGWKTRQNVSGQTVWVYRNRSGAVPPVCGDATSAEGIVRIVLRDRTSTSNNAIQYVVRARELTLPHSPAFPVEHLEATLALAARGPSGATSVEAILGQCAETVFNTPPTHGSKPYCKPTPASGDLRRVICKGP
jgi:hypothetical protein